MTSIHEEPVIYPSPSNPMAVARRIIQDHQLRDRREGLLTIRWWRGSFYEWKHSHWIEVADADIHSKLYHILERVHYEKKTKDGFELAPWEPTRNKIQNVAHALLGITFLSEHVEPPAWIEGANDDGNVLAMSNILLSLEGTRRQKIRQTPCHFNMFAVPYDYEPDAPEPEQWLEFLHQLWPKDEQSIALLQEWFGYILSSETDQQKILLLVGKRRGGKGTIARILTALVGKENTAGPTLASLGTNFGLSPLLGKAVAIVSDARLSGNVSTIVEQGLGLIVFGVFAGAHGRPRNASARAGSRPMWRNPAAIRVCPACRSSPMARLRKAAMTCGPALVRMRLASSAKVTSRTPCSPSTCQCARSNAPSRSASAWSAVRQVTALTSSVCGCLPARSVVCRCTMTTCAAWGKFRSGGAGATQVVRCSIRPWPRSTVRCAGGKRLLTDPVDRLDHPRLVALDHQQIGRPTVLDQGAWARWVWSASAVTTRPARSTWSSRGPNPLISLLLASTCRWATTTPWPCTSAASRCGRCPSAPLAPRIVLPSTATADRSPSGSCSASNSATSV